ncbi:hypothetical protein BN938_1195 [Mucinivorans hirudinis]|uniref:DUF2975 domain-containing protein n=1 Tax=Mucinivorans hirudinis TaxID=1433126 RepID=A0A060RCW5_9BACT|nr:hypothetical protein BN938_1195 [Mucinivorans hirudinis]
MKTKDKSKRRLDILLGLGGGVTLSAFINDLGGLIKIFQEYVSQSVSPASDFMRGMAAGLNLTGFIVVMIIIWNIYQCNRRNEKLFSFALIYYVTLFGLLQVVSSLLMTFGQGGAGNAERFQIMIGLLIIIFAQIFRRALKMQQEEELTI